MSLPTENSSQLRHQPRLVVVGCGAMGSELCRLLIQCDFKYVLLVDPDLLEERNLALSPLFLAAERLGEPKVKIISHTARERKNLQWEFQQAEIADVGFADLAAYDILISCTDSALARVETAFAARALRIPMIDGGVQSDQIPEGRCAFFAPDADAACYLCGLKEDTRASLLAYALSPSLSCAVPPDFPPMTAAPAIIRAVAETIIACIAGMSSSLASKRSFAQRVSLGRDVQTYSLTFSRDCPWHSLPERRQLVAVQDDETFFDVLTRHGSSEMVLELPWSICLSARCRFCDERVERPYRAAWVRRRLACPTCGAVSMEPIELIGELSIANAWVHRKPRQLGLPSRHLYSLRSAVQSGLSSDRGRNGKAAEKVLGLVETFKGPL